MRTRNYITFIFLLILSQNVWGQDYGKLPDLVDIKDARIIDIGVAVRDIETYVKTDPVTQKTDTALLINDPEIVWQSEQVNVYDSVSVSRAMAPRRAAHRAARRKALINAGLEQWGNLNDSFFEDFHYYVFRYEYPSVDADGNAVMLSAIAACPTPKVSMDVNNIIIGTHATPATLSESKAITTLTGIQIDGSLLKNNGNSLKPGIYIVNGRRYS